MINKKNWYQLVIIVLLIFASTMQSLGAEGQGEGGGQNQDTPLSLVSCSIQDGQKDVPADAAIRLEFSKNIVNMTVAENNTKCFALSDSDGNAVSVEVQMGDDQVDPAIKRIITVVPKEPLTEGKNYILTISGELKAKNGAVLGTPVRISFQTAGIADSADQAENTPTAPTAPGVTGGSLNSVQNPDTDASSQAQAEHGPDPRKIFSAACFIAAAGLLILYAYRRMKK